MADRVRTATRKVPLSDPGRLQEVYAATLDAVADVGYERFNMDLIAQRVRASKATLYQRWPSKANLIMDALRHVDLEFTVPDTGSFLGDLRLMMLYWLQLPQVSRPGLMLAVLEGSRRDPELYQLLMNRADERWARERTLDVIHRAIARRELPEDVDPELMLLCPFAVAMARMLVPGTDDPEELVNRVVDKLVKPLLTHMM
ncbi:TetR/AcrR family transcriptional regulator [Pseudonocardiaceae bacterium YIM PH 21723]|nr:TetR/AcrR family transcriptional regulator [Pseudonocardiaceae bacterium YIM PH 21723]